MPSPNNSFTVLNSENGLVIGSVDQIYQDKEGYIWIGGADGLARYDAYDFKIFRHDAGDVSSISNNAIRDIIEDKDGRLWVATGTGLNLFDRNTQTFRRFLTSENKDKGLVHNHVRSMTLDKNGLMWIGTYGGLTRLDTDTLEFKHFPQRPDHPEFARRDHVTKVMFDRHGMLWTTSDGGGVSIFNPHTETFENFRSDINRPDSLAHDVVWTVMEDSKGTIWLGTDSSMDRFNPDSKTFTHYRFDPATPFALSGKTVIDIMEDQQGNLWIGTNNGVSVLNTEKNEFIHILHDPLNPRSIAGNIVRDIFEDNNGDIWIGTFPDGLSILNRGNMVFQTFYLTSGQFAGFSSNSVLSFLEDSQDRFWIGTDGGGLIRFDEGEKIAKVYQPDLNNPRDPTRISGNAILSLVEDHEQHIWIGTWGAGLNRLDPKNEQFEHFFYDHDSPFALKSNNIWELFIDSKQRMWIGTIGGSLSLYKKQNHSFMTYGHSIDDPTTVNSSLVWTIIESANGSIWLGTGDGLDRLNPETGLFEHYKKDHSGKNSLSNNVINALFEDKDGILWLGTRGGGLNRFNPKTGEVKAYTRSAGLPNDVVVSIEQDSLGYLWLGTNHGLARFNPATEKSHNFDLNNGLQGNQFNINASIRLKNGELIFGGTRGYTRFDPNLVFTNQYLPPVIISDLKIFNRSVSANDKNSILNKVISQTDEITLNYKQSVFSFEFSALNYRNAKRNQYAYYLEGFDKDWNYVEDKRSATYTNLDPGTYLFRVKAANDEGLWNHNARTIKVTILPPPWRTWWAYSIYLTLSVAALYYLIHLQRKKVEQEHAVQRNLEMQVAERTNELQEKNVELKTAYEKLEEISYADPLTDLYNRRYLYKFLPHDIAKVIRAYIDMQKGIEKRDSQTNDLLFFLIDIDDFKSINDRFGHVNGDLVLKDLAKILKNASRDSDCLIRWGGEEFLIVCRFEDRNKAPAIAERLRRSVEKHQFVLENFPPIKRTCSIGFACYPFNKHRPTVDSPEQIIDIADWCLYTVKRNNKNGWMGIYHAGRQDIGVTDIKEKIHLYIESEDIEIATSIQGKIEYEE